MPDPYDYTSAFANLQSPGDSFLRGIQGGVALNQLQIERQQKQAALAQQQQMQSELASLSKNPTPEAIGSLMVKYPALSEQLKRATDVLTPAQQQAQLDHGAQVYAAVLNNQPEVAQRMLTERATALRNSGNEREAAASEMFSTMIKDHPEFAKTTMGLRLASAMGSDKFTEAFKGFGAEQRASELQPDLVLKGKSEAEEAGAKAKVATGTVPALIQKPVEENLSAAAARKVAQMNAEIAAANSETQRGQLVLERDKFIADQKLKTSGVAADTQNQMDTIGQSIETVKTLMKHPGLSSGTGMGGDFRAWFNGSDAKDFRAMADTLKSQQFLTQAKEMKGMGALSDAEGARIERAVASLDYAQSTNQFKNALGVILKTLEKGQAKVVASGKLPTTGGAFVVKHPTFGNVNEGDINRLLAQFPGASREQVLMFLSQGGAK
jgi:hypothetical protein